MLVPYTIYSKQVIFSKVTTSCVNDITVITRRKFSKRSKRGTLQNPCQIIHVVKSILKSQEWSLDLHFCLKKVSTKDVFFRIFRSNVNTGFGKIAGCVLLGRKQLVFGTFFEKNLWWSLLIVDVWCVHCRLATLLK